MLRELFLQKSKDIFILACFACLSSDLPSKLYLASATFIRNPGETNSLIYLVCDDET